jgi:hypothetical protein
MHPDTTQSQPLNPNQYTLINIPTNTRTRAHSDTNASNTIPTTLARSRAYRLPRCIVPCRRDPSITSRRGSSLLINYTQTHASNQHTQAHTHTHEHSPAEVHANTQDNAREQTQQRKQHAKSCTHALHGCPHAYTITHSYSDTHTYTHTHVVNEAGISSHAHVSANIHRR